jgi:hypothetical protein
MSRRPLMSAVCGAALLLASPAARAQDADLFKVFQHPTKDMRPRGRWWWPGGAVSDVELAREVGAMDEAGFGGAEIQAFNPGIPNLTPQERARIDDYANPAFFAHVKAAADAALNHGMTLDYTFGSAWPSGGGFAITPDKALLELTMSRTEVAGGASGPVKLAMPTRTRRLGAFSSLDPRSHDPRIADWPARMDARAHVVAVVAVKGGPPALKPAAKTLGLELFPWSDVTTPGALQEGSVQVLTSRLRPDGTLDWSPPPGTWQVFVFEQFASNTSAMGAAGEGPQLVVNHMDASAFAAHAARVGDPLVKDLGPSMAGIKATFVDSLELFQDLPWTEDFLTEFKARRGYDLTPYLPLILQPGWMQAWGEHYSPPYFETGDAVAERVRADYRQTVSDLMLARFVGPFVAWNHAHGLKAKFQAHGGALDILKGYGMADIPETEDLVNAGDPYFMRFARSAADLYGRPVVSAESMVWANRAYAVTPDELRKRADLIFSGGVDAIMEHGVDYRLHADAWPGWHAFAPSAFSGGFSTMLAETNPIWAALPRLNGYIARTSAILRQGRPVTPVAVYYGQIGYYVGIEDHGLGDHAMEKALLASGYDFDRINPDSIAKARVEHGQLISAGGQRYGVLVLPKINGLPAETAEQIAGFARAGLKVVFTDAPPSRDVTLANAGARDARVRAAVAAILRAGARIVPAGEVAPALRASGVPADLTFTGGDRQGLIFVQRRAGPDLITFVHNLADTPRDASLVLPGRGGVERWDAMDGGRRHLASSAAQGGVAVALPLAGGESALLVQGPGVPVGPAPTPRVVAELPLPADGWDLTVEGHATKGAPVSEHIPAATLADWRDIPALAHVSGVGTYRRSFILPAGWGGHAQVKLALGAVHDLAVVRLNGRTLPAAISSPYDVVLGPALKPGVNTLEIAVSNTPENAMVDPSVAALRTLPTAPAGLIGPVSLQAVR